MCAAPAAESGLSSPASISWLLCRLPNLQLASEDHPRLSDDSIAPRTSALEHVNQPLPSWPAPPALTITPQKVCEVEPAPARSRRPLLAHGRPTFHLHVSLVAFPMCQLFRRGYRDQETGTQPNLASRTVSSKSTCSSVERLADHHLLLRPLELLGSLSFLETRQGSRFASTAHDMNYYYARQCSVI